jgi:hypothetical protein
MTTGLEVGCDNSSVELLSQHLTIWLLLRGGEASLSAAKVAFSTSGQDLVSAVARRRSLIVSGDALHFCGHRDSARKALAEHDILAVIEHIVIAQNRLVDISEISELSGEPESRVRWAISNYRAWSRRYRPSSKFELDRCFSDWPPADPGAK